MRAVLRASRRLGGKARRPADTRRSKRSNDVASSRRLFLLRAWRDTVRQRERRARRASRNARFEGRVAVELVGALVATSGVIERRQSSRIGAPLACRAGPSSARTKLGDRELGEGVLRAP